MGRKDLIKIENTFLSEDQVDSWRYMHRKPRLTVSTTMKWLQIAPQSARAHRQCAGLPEQHCISHAEPVSSSFAVRKRANISRSNANTVKKSFPIMWCWPLIAVGNKSLAPYNEPDFLPRNKGEIMSKTIATENAPAAIVLTCRALIWAI